jgi:hypothetical protein
MSGVGVSARLLRRHSHVSCAVRINNSVATLRGNGRRGQPLPGNAT